MMYEKALDKAREQRRKAASVEPVDVAPALAEKPEAIPAIEVRPVIATSTPTPKRPRRRRVRRILLLPFKIAAVIVFTAGIAGGSMVLATVKGGDISLRAYADAVQDLPAMIASKPCNFDHVNGTGCKS